MTNEEILKRFSFDLEIGAFNSFSYFNDFMLFDLRNTEKDTGLRLYKVLCKLGYKPISYDLNLNFLDSYCFVSLSTKQKCFEFEHYQSIYIGLYASANPIPKYVLEYIF